MIIFLLIIAIFQFASRVEHPEGTLGTLWFSLAGGLQVLLQMGEEAGVGTSNCRRLKEGDQVPHRFRGWN